MNLLNLCLKHSLSLPCVQCLENQARGFAVQQLAGRCSNGAEKDAGRRWHALPLTRYRALCGVTYGRRSAGWSDYEIPGQSVTCPKCAKKIEKQYAIQSQKLS